MEWPPWGSLSPLTVGRKKRGGVRGSLWRRKPWKQALLRDGSKFRGKKQSGRGSWWAQGRSVFQGTFLWASTSFTSCILPSTQMNEFKNFRKLETLSGSNPSPSVLQGKGPMTVGLLCSHLMIILLSLKLCLTADQFHLIWARLLAEALENNHQQNSPCLHGELIAGQSCWWL